jgi:protein-tyrosine phosphatase
MQLDNSPSLKQTIDFCVEASRFLEVNEKNVIAVHCSNGVNRSGLMISCLLILMKICNSAEEAAQYFGGKRCVKKEALFLPSQRRYVYYYEDYLRSWAEKGVPVPSNGLRIVKDFFSFSFNP